MSGEAGDGAQRVVLPSMGVTTEILELAEFAKDGAASGISESSRELLEREDLLLAKELAERLGGIPYRSHIETISPFVLQVKG